MYFVSGENKQMGMPGYTAFLPGAHTRHGHVSPPSHHIVSLTPFSHAPENTCVLLPILPFYPFPPLDLNLSINNFYVASTGGVCGVIGSLNFKFQVSQDTEEQQIVTAQAMWLLHCISTKIICITHTYEGVDLS